MKILPNLDLESDSTPFEIRINRNYNDGLWPDTSTIIASLG